MRQFDANRIPENTIYLIFWILMFAFPVFLSTGGNGIDWIRVLHETSRILPFLLVFLINNYLLFGLLKSKKYFSYFLSAAIVAVVFSFLGSYNYLVYDFLNIPEPPKGPLVDTRWIINDFFYNSIFAILGIGLNDAIKITIGWLQDRRKFEHLQKENLQNQLSLLQHQINPHFFMNTLNNIHALIDYDKDIAKNSVVKLSQMMRVLLYENENYTLQKEIDFLKDYIELMKIRVNENVDIKFEYPGNVPHVNFPPLLFISFVENSFKHGILATGRSFVHICFNFEDAFLHVMIRNSRSFKTNHKTVSEKIGMDNSRKRLDLIYNNMYKFDITETETTYKVNIKIPLPG
jgi:hypothetical protein